MDNDPLKHSKIIENINYFRDNMKRRLAKMSLMRLKRQIFRTQR